MERKNCPGCKTHFEQGTLLPPEGISIELKNYPIPIKDQSHKLKLLKTIISFLNSKGGTIYIGAVDETREVVGVVTQRKQQDNFRIFIQQLTDRIQPKVDLTDKQDIIVQFVPVVNKGKFIGKHLIKVIVKQGDPSQQYCFTKKIQLQAVNDKKVDEYEIVYSYIRLNSGNLKELKGYELVQEVKAKAAKPHAQCNCFHDECNPQPLCMTVDILKIGFSNIFESQTREILQQWFEIYLTQLNIVCPISYDQQNKMIVVEFQTKPQIAKAEDFITSHLKQLNENLDGICHFDKKDKFLDCIIFQNTLKRQKVEEKKVEEPRTKINKREKAERVNKTEKIDITEQKSEIKREKKTEAEETKYVYETAGRSEEFSKNVKGDEKKDKKNESASNKQTIQQKSSRKVETSKKQEGSQKKKQFHMVQKIEKQLAQQNEQKNYIKKFSFTFTHINPNSRNQLRNYLDSLCKCKKNFQIYKNTIEVFLPNQDKYQEFYYKVMEKNAQIGHFGFRNQIRFGNNSGVIDIMNYDKTKNKAIVNYLKNLIGKQLKQIEPCLQGNRHVVKLALSKPAACIWLDKLLENKEIKEFSIPGAEKNQKPKMKILLVCQDPAEEDVYEFGMF